MLTTIQVTTFQDVIDANDGLTSLREAVIESNNSTASDITIQLQAGAYSLTRSGGGEDFAQTGDLDIHRSVTIVGNPPPFSGLGDVTFISGVQDTVIFDILGSGQIDVTFRDLALVEGRGRGAAIRANPNGGTVTVEGGVLQNNAFRGPSGDDAIGGAIYIDDGTLILDDTDVVDNEAVGSSGANGTNGGDGRQALGGGIYAINTDVIIRNGSEVSLNRAIGGDGGDATGGGQSGGNAGQARGGGIFHSGGTLTITDSSVLGNTARGGSGGDGFRDVGRDGGEGRGGGLFVDGQTSDVTITTSFLSQNEAIGGDGGGTRSGEFDGQRDAGDGANASGGGLFSLAPLLTVTDTSFSQNTASGGNGGDTMLGNAGDGGAARGGAISVDAAATTQISGTLTAAATDGVIDPDLTQGTATTRFIENSATGGDGGGKMLTDITGGTAGSGGFAGGGAIYHSQSGVLGIDQAALIANAAYSGFGGHGDTTFAQLVGQDNRLSAGLAGGGNGTARGGAIDTRSDLTLTASAVVSNLAAAGGTGEGDRIGGGRGGLSRFGDGFNGGYGGDAYGGAVYVDEASATVVDSGLMNNSAVGGFGGVGGSALAYQNDDGVGLGAGGDGGDGGDAYGGAIAASLLANDTLDLQRSLIGSNSVIAGRGGLGGFGALIGNAPGVGPAIGGDGGDGGEARGGGVYVAHAGASSIGGDLLGDELIASGNRVLGGDGGDAGHGGSGFVNAFNEEDDTGFSSSGGAGGDGGDGGNAEGGGFYLLFVDAVVEETTIDSNVVSSGWGGDGGYGGSGDLTGQAAGVDLTFDLLSNSPYPQYGGDGGDGGDAGDALGGGLRVRGGTLQLINSTVYQNVVVGGGGGDGGDGGVGTLGGGDAGNGGMGGDARGGGIYAVGDGTEIALVGSTVAANVVNAGPGGQGGKAGPIAADSVGTADAQLRVFGTFGNSLAVVTPDFSPFVDSSAAVITQEAAATDPILASFVQADQQASDGDVISADFYVDLATGIAIRTAAGVSGVAAGAAAVGVVVVSQFFTAVQATSLTATALSGTFLVAALPIGAVGALVTVGVVVLVKIGVALINGASFGEAVEAAIDVPDTGDGPNLATLFGGGNAGQTFVNQVFTGPGSNGSDGTGGAVSGSGIAGDVFLQRSLVADNSARGRQLTKTIEAAPPFSVPLINEPEGFAGVLEVADQTVFDIAVTDVDENSLILSDGRNLIGAAGGAVALANDLKGTVANPLDPMLQPALGMHGGDTPTLALLAGSPARDAISVAGSVTSQNGFVTTGTSSIGAWAGVDSQSLPGDYNGDLAVNAADYTVWRDTLGLQVTPFSGADADGNGNVGVSDFVAWKNSFGVAAAQGEASVVSTPTAAPGSASPPVVLELDPARPTAAAIDDAHEDGADAAPWFAAAASSQLPIGSTEDPLQATPQDLPANRERSHSLLLLAITTPDEPASDDAAEVVDDVSADEAFAELAELAGIGLDLAFA